MELREARWSDCVGGEYSALHCTALHCTALSAVQYLQACGGWPGRGRAAPGDTWLLGRTAWSVWRSGLLAEADVPEFEGELEVTEAGGTDIPVLYNTALQIKPIKLLINTMRKT